MAIPQLDLDDRTFDQLAAEGRALIQRYFPAWTDYNPSDPGITLIELFAYLIEAAIYQINRVPERSLWCFASLVGVERQADEPIAQTLSRALASLQQHYRAVSAIDFETLTLEVDGIARVKAVVQDCTAANKSPFFPRDQLVRIVVIPSAADLTPVQLQALHDQVFFFLAPHRLVTTKVQVVSADYTPIDIAVTVVRASASPLDTTTIGTNVCEAISYFLDDRHGGFDGTGWPFGRSVYRSDLYRVIGGLDGIDHVKELLLDGSDNVAELPLHSSLSLIKLKVLVTVL